MIDSTTLSISPGLTSPSGFARSPASLVSLEWILRSEVGDVILVEAIPTIEQITHAG